MHSMWDEGGHSRCYLTHVPFNSDNRHSSDIFSQVINLNRGCLGRKKYVHLPGMFDFKVPVLWIPSCDQGALLHG